MTTVKVRLLKSYWGVCETGATTFHQKGEILEGTLAGPMHANGFKATGENTVLNLSFFETLKGKSLADEIMGMFSFLEGG